MKKTQDCASYFFVDESGDPVFYDAKGNLIVGLPNGSSPLLILGFIETQDAVSMRKAIWDLQKEIINDPYFLKIPSLAKTGIAFHAKDDAPEIRYLFYKLLKELDFKAQFVVARKIAKVFRNDFNANENKFYDHLVTKAFRDVLHRYRYNHITFAVRGSSTRQQPLSQAIFKAKEAFEEMHGEISTTITVEPQSPKGEPCLSVIDYVSWALQRAYTRREMRYYDYIGDKVSFIRDIYDSKVYPKNRYYHKATNKEKGASRRTKENLFDISKATPL
jgi:hypothetical protein